MCNGDLCNLCNNDLCNLRNGDLCNRGLCNLCNSKGRSGWRLEFLQDLLYSPEFDALEQFGRWFLAARHTPAVRRLLASPEVIPLLKEDPGADLDRGNIRPAGVPEPLCRWTVGAAFRDWRDDEEFEREALKERALLEKQKKRR